MEEEFSDDCQRGDTIVTLLTKLRKKVRSLILRPSAYLCGLCVE